MQIAKDDGTFLVIVLYQNDCDIKDIRAHLLVANNILKCAYISSRSHVRNN